MARRKAAAAVEAKRVEAPPYIRQINLGFRHFAEPGEPFAISGPWRRRWQEARDRWCLEKGCHRKAAPCAKAFPRSRKDRPCGAGERLGR